MRKLFLLLIALALLCTYAHAVNLTLQPGDQVYLGETVDISLVVGWKDMFAWWSTGVYGETPEVVVDASSFQHKFYLDPAKFKVGRWYKWDGIYEPHADNLAFEILEGTRPVPTPVPSNFTEILITPVPTPTQYQPKATHILIAKSDGGLFEYYLNTNDTTYGNGHIWLFGRKQNITDQPLTKAAGDLYTYEFNPHITADLDAGWYTGYLQFDGKNGMQDVYYDKEKNTLDSPFKAVEPVDLTGFLPQRIQSEFELLAKNKDYFDDHIISITMEVQEPILQFTDYYVENDQIVIEGNSPMAAGTTVSFIIDPGRYTNDLDKKAHTVTTKLRGLISEQRIFREMIPVEWEQLSIGMHTVVGTIETDTVKVSQNKDFPVTDILVNPTPRGETRKVIVEAYGWHVVNNTNTTYAVLSNGTIMDIPVQTPQYIYVNTTIEVEKIVYRNITITPEPTEPTMNIPLSPVVGIGALVICAYIVLRR